MAALSDILIDDRDGSKDLIPLIPGCVPCRLSYSTTPQSGPDLMWLGNGPVGPVSCGVELKSVSDLLSSIQTGRLQATQLRGLLADHDERWLLYYGAYRPDSAGVLQVRQGKGWRGFRLGARLVPYGYLEAMLLEISLSGVHVKWVHDTRDAAAWVQVAYRWWSKEWDEHKGMRVIDRSSAPAFMPDLDDRQRRAVEVACRLPGLGFEKAVAAVTHFRGSIRDMVNATPADWQCVDGVGKVIARAISEGVV